MEVTGDMSDLANGWQEYDGASPASCGFVRYGQIRPRPTYSLPPSRWSIGGETLDRNYASYDAYKTYLDELGAKRIRLQGGWARCERHKGVYDFAWLDAIVDDALARGVQPWLELSYGNPLYRGGGEAALAGGIPYAPEALAAWDAWVDAIVRHFGGRVREWEIWNEPDLGEAHAKPPFTAEAFAAFHGRTVDRVLALQPEARIIAMALAHLPQDRPAHLGDGAFVRTLLETWMASGQAEKLFAVSYHQYCHVPEHHYPALDAFRQQVRVYAPQVQFWQGENGAPSVAASASVGALANFDWDEVSQAKWVLRRMAGDMAHDVDVTNIFQIADMHYSSQDFLKGCNAKGLLEARPDLSIARRKRSYYAYRNMAFLFGGAVQRLPLVVRAGGNPDLEVHAFFCEILQASVLVCWQGGAVPHPAAASQHTFVDLVLEGIAFHSPVAVDPLDGAVAMLPPGCVPDKPADACRFVLHGLPVTDSPLILVEQADLAKLL